MDKLFLNDIQGAKWVFLVNEKNQLCYERGNQTQILLNDVCQDFDIVTDENGNFHLITQALDGSLIYLIYDFENWKKYVILSSKSAKSTMRKFKSFIFKGEIHCFYLLDFDSRSMLIHHRFSSGNPSVTPKVIGYSNNFSCAMDCDGAIHIFFFDQSNSFQYKIYKKGTYSEKMCPTDDNIQSIYALCDSDGNLHLLYVARMTSFYTLIYFCDERKIISFGEVSPDDFCLNIRGRLISIEWRERQRYYQCKSSDGGSSFKKPAPITESKQKRAVPIRLRSGSNPVCFNCDRCIVTSNGNNIDLPIIKPSSSQHNHKIQKNSYNIKDTEYDELIKSMQKRISNNEKEIARINDKLSDISKKLKEMELPPILPPLQLSGKVEENTENYETFENTSLDASFENPKIF